MDIKKIALVSLLSSTAIIGGCNLEDEPKKLNVDQLCDSICDLGLKDSKELQIKLDKKYFKLLKEFKQNEDTLTGYDDDFDGNEHPGNQGGLGDE